MNHIQKIKVLVVDDSAMVRQMLYMELSKDESIDVVSTSPDPYDARDKILQLHPDVILLDIEMPRMDGLTFLKKLMAHYPCRVIIVSSLAREGGEVVMDAMDSGALDVVSKPSVAYSVSDMSELLIQKIKTAAQIPMWKIQNLVSESGKRIVPVQKKDATSEPQSMLKTTDKIIAIGASTGGTEAIREVLAKLPVYSPPIVIVQHMPRNFTHLFAERLNALCHITVKEAKDKDILSPGKALIAPGNYHMEIKRSGAVYFVKLNQDKMVFHQRPSVEILFNSVAKTAGRNAIGVIMTGMGKDGSRGLLNMREAGAFTMAQDEKSCIVFGMPKEAIELGAAVKIVPLQKIADEILKNV